MTADEYEPIEKFRPNNRALTFELDGSVRSWGNTGKSVWQPDFDLWHGKEQSYTYSIGQGEDYEEEMDWYNSSYASQCSFNSSEEQGSDNLLVTFDYGYCDSLDLENEEDVVEKCQVENDDDDYYEDEEANEETYYKAYKNEMKAGEGRSRSIYTIMEDFEKELNVKEVERDSVVEDHESNDKNWDGDDIWFYPSTTTRPGKGEANDDSNPCTNPFQVHRMQHNLKDSMQSLMSSYTEYDVDDGDVVNTNKTYDRLIRMGAFNYAGDSVEGRNGIPMDDEQFYDSIECV